MSTPQSYPYIARSVKKYRPPHASELSFAKGVQIRVLGLAPKGDQAGDAAGSDQDDDDDDEDDLWLVGELVDGSGKGMFPATHVVPDTEGPKLDDPADTQPVAAASLPQEQQQEQDQPPSITQAAKKAAAVPVSESETAAQPSIPAATPAVAQESRDPTTEATQSNSEKPIEPVPTPKAPPSTDTQAAAPTVPSAKPSGPPKPAPKPSALAARIAAFNQPSASAPPPLPRGKPAAGAGPAGQQWKRPQPQSSSSPSNEPQSQQPPPPPESQASKTNTGFSAADAASSIKMSLKERMAALQKGGTASANAGGDSSTETASLGASTEPRSPTASSKNEPAPGRLSADRRNVALAGFGGTSPSAPKEDDDGLAAPLTAEATGDADATDLPTEADATSEPQDISPEEQEAQRRAAIAQRMAKLGGQRFGPGGPGSGQPVFGAPAPVKKPSSGASVTTAEKEDTRGGNEQVSAPEDDGAHAVEVTPPPVTEKPSEQSLADQPAEQTPSHPAPSAAPTTLAVPRRTAPPRKKRSGASATDASPAASPSDPTPSVDEVPRLDSGESSQDAKSDGLTTTDSLVAESSSEAGIPAAESSDSVLAPAENNLPSITHRSDSPVPLVRSDEPAVVDAESRQGASDKRSSTGLSAATTSTDTADSSEAQLKQQRAQLNDFLSKDELSRRGSGLTVASVGGQSLASVGAEDADVEGVSSSETESSAGVPSALARQLGLTPSSEEGEVLPRGTIETVTTPQEVEQDQQRIGQDLNAARSDTPPPPPVAADDDEIPQITSPPPPRRPSSSAPRPPIPTAATPSQSAARPPSAGPSREVPTPPVSESMARNVSSGRPPVPKSPPPARRSENVSGGIEDVMQRGSVDDAVGPAPGPALAAPRPRHAVPVEEDEDAGDDELAADTVQEKDVEPVMQAKDEEDEAEAEPAELTPEEEEAERRARIARRMAALGGQRMGGLPPIMGAPMPPRRKPTQSEEQEPVEDEAAAAVPQMPEEAASAAPPAASRGVPRGGMAIPGMTQPVSVHDDEDTGEQGALEEEEENDEVDEAEQEIARPAKPMSPPPIPTSPPPVPTASRASVQGIKPPMSPPPRPPTTSSSVDSTGASPSRRSSIRPPIPSAVPQRHSQQPSIESSLAGDGGYDDDDEEEEGEEAEGVERSMGSSPPPVLPTSPPPRAPPRAPSAGPPAPPPAAPVESAAKSGALGHTPSASLSSSAEPTGFSSSHSNEPRSARDLDLVPSSRWWRQGVDPLRLPATIGGRPDAIFSVQTADGQSGKHSAVIRVLFEDYSLTRVNVEWVDGDESESQTHLSQSHEFPPARPGGEQLKQWSGTVGVSVAQSALMSKGSSSQGATNSYASIHSVVMSSTRGAALPPVGQNFGPTILNQVGSTILDRGGDEIRAGDVVLLQGADFKGKKGLSSYHLTFGTAHEGVYGIVVEVADSKKRKLRVAIANASGVIEESQLKLEDVKAGLVKVMRVAPRGGWVREF